MEYLYKVLGIKATVQRAEFDHLPNLYSCKVSFTEGIHGWTESDFSLSKDRVGSRSKT